MVAWRTGEAVIGTKKYFERVRFDEWVVGSKVLNKYEEFRGRRDPCWLAEEETERGGAEFGEEGEKMYRLWLRKMDLMNLCFMEGCSGCQALVSGTEAHLEACRERKNNALESTDEGRVRRKRQLEKENEALPNTWRRGSECRTRRGSARRRVWDEETTGTSSSAV